MPDAESSIDIESRSLSRKSPRTEHKLNNRLMTKNQELWNAATMLLTPLIGLYFLSHSSFWITNDDLAQAQHEMLSSSSFQYQEHCISSSYFPHLYAEPPLATVSIVMGYLLHTPCSIYYHLLCAYHLKPGKERIHHWSRRLDQVMIQVMGMFISYGLSSSATYTFLILLYVIDSAFRLFQSGPIRSKSNQIRMGLSIVLTVLPVAYHGFQKETAELVLIYATSFWVFLAYPFGGYSHGIFHIVIACTNPIQLAVSTKLWSSRENVQTAAKCAILEGEAI